MDYGGKQMKFILYPITLLFLFYSLGSVTIKLLRLQNTHLVRDNVFGPLIVGFVVNLSILETFGLFLPISVATVALIVLSIIGFFTSFEDIKKHFFSDESNYKILFVLVIVPLIILLLPQILKNEWFIGIGDNNDFAYYIASIDWLTNHSILEPIGYSQLYPLFSMAEYMIDLTRIGTDLTGAYVASLFSIESYEAYSVLIPISGILVAAAIYSVTIYFTKNRLCGLCIGIYAAICGNSIALILAQYVPQMLGISCLLLSFATIHELLFRTSSKVHILTGLIISGVLAIYCEYTVYILFVAIAFLVIAIIWRKPIHIRQVIGAIISAILFNVYGFYKAVNFNWTILHSVLDGGTSTIDPYFGQMLSIWRKLGILIGLSGKGYLEKSSYLYALIALSCAILILACIAVPLIKKDRELAVFTCSTISVIILLELYFLHNQAAYQEYKHLTSASVILLANISILIATLVNQLPCFKKKAFLVSGIGMLGIISIWNPMKYYINPSIALDSSTVELRDAAMLVPHNEPICIDSSIPVSNYMCAVYALKDVPVNLNENNGSYLHFFQTFDDDISKYTVYSRKDEISPNLQNKMIIWSNDKYILTENKEALSDNYKKMQITGDGWGHMENTIIFKESDCVMNEDGTEGFVLFGPYISMDGFFNVRLEYTVLQGTGNIGYFDIYDSGTVIASVPLEAAGTHKVELKNIEFKDNMNVEFRVFVNEGAVIKIEELSYKEIEK